MKMKMNDYLDYVNDIKNDIKHFEEIKNMYLYTYLNYPDLTEETVDYLEDKLLTSYDEIDDSKNKLNILYEMGKK